MKSLTLNGCGPRVIKPAYAALRKDQGIRAQIRSKVALAESCFGSRVGLARAMAVTPQSLDHWRNGRRLISRPAAEAIEYVTDGTVTREEVAPLHFGRLDRVELLRNAPKKQGQLYEIIWRVDATHSIFEATEVLCV